MLLLKRIFVSFIVCLSCFHTHLIAQTCNSLTSETTPDSRFSDQGDGTVLDSITQLVWKRCSEGQVWENDSCSGNHKTYNWLHAQNQVDTVNADSYAGQTDWRLPNKPELRSIVEYQCASPAINETFFPNTPSAGYWTSSPYFKNFGDYQAWYINFSTGSNQRDWKVDIYAVRLVRGG